MTRQLFVSNCNCLSHKDKNVDFDLLLFNPWGFSKAHIATSVQKSIDEFAMNEYEKINLFFIPLFFGRRCLFVEAQLERHFQKAIFVKQSRCLICNQKQENCNAVSY